MKIIVLIPLLLFTSMLLIAQDSYTLSNESTLTVDGTSTLHDWTVTANTIQGALQSNAQVFTTISFEVDVTSIVSTRGATMDKKTHNALKMEEHPKIVFSAREVAFSEGSDQHITGKLTIAGVQKDVVIVVAIKESEGKIQIRGNHKIILQDYDMEPPTAMFGSIVVGDEVTVNFDLIFAK
ncbi:MAG: YceI family protein [Maribacter sp.]|uniref:YceI family protein n=1 Tax=Maribacter sp. TaxID=1897614 RepID=UPI003C70D91F